MRASRRRASSTRATGTKRSLASRISTGSRTTRSSSARSWSRHDDLSERDSLHGADVLCARDRRGAALDRHSREVAAERRHGADDRRLRQPHVLHRHDLHDHQASADHEHGRGPVVRRLDDLRHRAGAVPALPGARRGVLRLSAGAASADDRGGGARAVREAQPRAAVEHVHGAPAVDHVRRGGSADRPGVLLPGVHPGPGAAPENARPVVGMDSQPERLQDRQLPRALDRLLGLYGGNHHRSTLVVSNQRGIDGAADQADRRCRGVGSVRGPAAVVHQRSLSRPGGRS